jgi:hypothetical protein
MRGLPLRCLVAIGLLLSVTPLDWAQRPLPVRPPTSFVGELIGGAKLPIRPPTSFVGEAAGIRLPIFKPELPMPVRTPLPTESLRLQTIELPSSAWRGINPSDLGAIERGALYRAPWPSGGYGELNYLSRNPGVPGWRGLDSFGPFRSLTVSEEMGVYGPGRYVRDFNGLHSGLPQTYLRGFDGVGPYGRGWTGTEPYLPDMGLAGRRYGLGGIPVPGADFPGFGARSPLNGILDPFPMNRWDPSSLGMFDRGPSLPGLGIGDPRFGGIGGIELPGMNPPGFAGRGPMDFLGPRPVVPGYGQSPVGRAFDPTSPYPGMRPREFGGRPVGPPAGASQPTYQRPSPEALAKLAVEERANLAQRLRGVSELLERGDIGEASALARQPSTWQHLEVPEVIQKGLARPEQLDAQSQALRQLEAAFPAGQAREVPSLLGAVRVERLPSELQVPVRGLRGLNQLQAEASRPWLPTTDVASIRSHLADLEAAGGSPTWVREVQQDLAAKAFLDGYPAAARQLLPADGPPAHARALLRDLKNVLAGGDEVSSGPARQALTPPAGQGGGSGKPPPGVKALLPEEPSDGWRPPVRESALAGLEPLAGTEQEEAATLRARVTAGMQYERLRTNLAGIEVGSHLAAMHRALGSSGIDRDRDEKDKELERVEAALERKLSPAERILAGHLQSRGKSAWEIAVSLR